MTDPKSTLVRRLFEYVTAAGVIVSIVFVGLELRQNTAAVRGATYQELAATSAELTLALANDGDLARIFVRWEADPESLSADEKLRIRVYLLGVGRNMENAFQQARVGTITDDLWMGYLDTYRRFASMPGFGQYWDGAQTGFSTEFRAYVDSAMLQR